MFDFNPNQKLPCLRFRLGVLAVLDQRFDLFKGRRVRRRQVQQGIGLDNLFSRVLAYLTFRILPDKAKTDYS